MAFAGSNVRSVVIPDSVTTWGEVTDCDGDELPKSCEPIAQGECGTFAECLYLKEVEINSETVPSKCFINCMGLQSVTLGEKTQYIESKAFYKNTKLSKVTVKSNLKEIGRCAFMYCQALSSIYLGNELEKIDYLAFAGTGLTSVAIPNSVKSWGVCDMK